MNDDQFADTFPPAPNAGLFHQLGGRYHGNSKFTQEQNTQDAPVSIKGDEDMFFYGLFCGFKNGGDLARFAMNRMVYELFLTEQPINKNSSPETICNALRQKFLSVDRRCFEEVDDQLLKLFVCQETEPRDDNRISELESKVRAGCTALIVLRIHDDLYILNCGTSQALILTDSKTPTIVRLLSGGHDDENPEEVIRLKGLNIDPQRVSAPTRALGDFFRKKEKYDEDQDFTNAKGPPVIAEPEINYVKIKQDWKHLILVSGGTIQNIKDCESEDDFLTEIREQFTEEVTVSGTASTLVFKVARKHKDTYDRHVNNNRQVSTSNHCEEMSVIYVRLREGLPIITSTDDSLDSTMGSTMQEHEPESFEPYVDLVNARIPKLDKFLVIP